MDNNLIVSLIISALVLSYCTCALSEEIDENTEAVDIVEANFENRSIDARIVGGKRARLGQFPYQASLYTDNRPMCGGTIISKTYISTAAHCVVDRNNAPIAPNRLSVRVGSILLNSGGQVITVAEVKVHPEYKFPVFDIGLLRLTRELVFTRNIRSLPLAKVHPRPGLTAIVSGYGATQTGGPMSNELRYVSLTTLSDEDCFKRAPKHASIFCLKHPSGRGICQGDSGGPAKVGNQLVGAMSFTLGACGTTEPDGFAKIASVNDWISKNSK